MPGRGSLKLNMLPKLLFRPQKIIKTQTNDRKDLLYNSAIHLNDWKNRFPRKLIRCKKVFKKSLNPLYFRGCRVKRRNFFSTN